jgi:hypothetical protein
MEKPEHLGLVKIKEADQKPGVKEEGTYPLA